MTLLDAKEYHPEKERKRRIRIISAIVLILILMLVGWFNRFWPQKRIADKFFSSLQKQDFETAYGLYFSDPTWKQHPQNHKQYPFNEFWQDWGPGGEWGNVKSYQIYGVDLIVNDRAKHAQLYVDKTDKTISTPPCDLEFR
jgi:hypothetical protein